jgi:glycosyltransferase involved in cell wall biosynthesis
MKVSVVVPLFNEEESVGVLYESIRSVIDDLEMEAEMIFVDDGSTDLTFIKASQIAEKDRRLRVVKFRRNYGQTPAMAAGIDLAAGGIIVTMDGDLQNDPRDIPEFLEKIDEGFDIVVGWRFNRQDKLAHNFRCPSNLINRWPFFA